MREIALRCVLHRQDRQLVEVVMARPAAPRRSSMVRVLVLPLLLLAFLLPSVAQASPRPGDVVAGSYIVTLDAEAPAATVATDHAGRHGAVLDHVYRHALRGYAARMSASQARAVAADPRVVAVEQDRVVTTQAKPGGDQTAQAQTRIDGELSSAASGNGAGAVSVDVAIIDTGIDVDHPDLNVVGGKNCVRGRNTFDDGNGHGTHVAGTVAAKDDGNGVVGVAPGARLWAIRVLDNRGSGTTSSVICGIDYVTANASTIEVANMSLGGSGTDSVCGGSDSYHNAICKSVGAGVTYAVAAGNSAADASTSRPATYDEVITVSALADFNGKPGGGAAPTCRSDVDDTFADFSNYGADVDLIAPGVCINSTWLSGGYNTISGTSMASPHVGGAAALYKASNPGASPAQVKSALQAAGNTDWNNADDPDSIKEKLLNVAAL
jgi:subtilisin family serine protease